MSHPQRWHLYERLQMNGYDRQALIAKYAHTFTDATKES
jgi:hypothetical protein